jgi:hypothetical protein
VPRLALKAIQIQRLATPTKQMAITKLFSTPHIPAPKTSPVPTFPKMKQELERDKRRRKAMFGEWFKRSHLIAPPSHLAKQFGFTKGGKEKYKI